MGERSNSGLFKCLGFNVHRGNNPFVRTQKKVRGGRWGRLQVLPGTSCRGGAKLIKNGRNTKVFAHCLPRSHLPRTKGPCKKGPSKNCHKGGIQEERCTESLLTPLIWGGTCSYMPRSLCHTVARKRSRKGSITTCRSSTRPFVSEGLSMGAGGGTMKHGEAWANHSNWGG